VKHLIFSDIHSNLEALEAVLEHASDNGVDSIMCLGDFVGYGANPNECVQRVAGLANVSAVLGNHDAAVLDPSQRDFFNPVAKAGIFHSEQQTEEASKEYLRALPMTVESPDGFLAVHSSPDYPEAWTYVLEPLEAADAFHAMAHPVAFIGHTHFPAVHSDNGIVKPFIPGDHIKPEPDRKVLINVGSVGQPRDGDSRAAYVIYDTDERTIDIFRVEYDIDAAAAKILDAGLPPMLADRLRRGY
jgi:diadenosine tetraphosphatase ApaH/serine/threonine PP2A family protein phosphatase